jgi:uncharacterized cupin superfamily protein
MPVPEARIVETTEGKVVEGEGWFVLNVGEARWVRYEGAGAYVSFESPEARFPEFGVNIHVLEPGEPNSLYHREEGQEDFLVLAGECILLVEGEARRLNAWDFVHCPAWTEHVFVGAGDGPCAILMIGPRTRKGLHYPRNEKAAAYNASAAKATDSAEEAYSIWSSAFTPTRMPWPVS